METEESLSVALNENGQPSRLTVLSFCDGFLSTYWKWRDLSGPECRPQGAGSKLQDLECGILSAAALTRVQVSFGDGVSALEAPDSRLFSSPRAPQGSVGGRHARPRRPEKTSRWPGYPGPG